MKKRSMIVISAAVYAFFAVCFFATLTVFRNDEEALSLAVYIIVSGLSVATVLLALCFVRESPSERYREMYGEDREER